MTSSNVFVKTGSSTYQGFPQLFGRMRRDVYPSRKVKTSANVVTVGKLLTGIKTVPSYSILLGACKDGLPFLMQLSDPTMGALLIGGDPGCGKTHQLQVMVDSAIRLNAPHDLQVSIVTHKPNEWRSFWKSNRQEKYLYQLKAWYDPSTERLIEGLTRLAEARREEKQKGAAILLLLDDFNFLENLSYEAQVNLHWLLAYGAQSGIWVAAAIKSNYAPEFRYWIDSFRTRILGAVMVSENAEILSARNDYNDRGLTSGVFRVWTGQDWLAYRLPLLGD